MDALKLNRAKAAALRTEEADTKKLKKAIDLVESKKVVMKKPIKPYGQVLVVPTELERPILKEVEKIVEKPDSDNSSSEEEEVVVVKKKKPKVVSETKGLNQSRRDLEKPKKKKKVITIEISDTESEEEDEPIVEKPLPSSLPSRKMITLQNRKSLIKVHKPAEPVFNMFCD